MCKRADVMELADVTDSKSVELITRVGSSPTIGTSLAPVQGVFFLRKRIIPIFS